MGLLKKYSVSLIQKPTIGWKKKLNKLNQERLIWYIQFPPVWVFSP